MKIKSILMALSITTALFLIGISIIPNDVPPGPMAIASVLSVLGF